MLEGHTEPSFKILGFVNARLYNVIIADLFSAGNELESISILLNEIFT